MGSLIKFSLLALMAVALIDETIAGPSQSSYLIKRREIDDVPEALTLLRRFLSRKLTPNERCERYAVLLDNLDTSTVDQFSVADLGLSSNDNVHRTFEKLGMEDLRDLYKNGISAFDGSRVDKSMFELVDCLRNKFLNIDGKVLTFLNKAELQESIKQYESIVNQPLTFLLDPNAKHPQLTRGQLTPMITKSLVDLFDGDQSKVDAKFAPDAQVPPVVAAAAAEAEAAAPGPIELSPEELAHLEWVSDSLDLLYQSLPSDAKPADRCQAYSRIIETDPREKTVSTADDVSKEASDRIAASGPTEGQFMPAEPIRENFLFTMAALSPQQLEGGTYVDLLDCMSPWASENNVIAEYLNSPELAQIMSDLLEQEDAHAEAAAAASATGATE